MHIVFHADLVKITKFKKRDGKTINILKEIGRDYHNFGIRLLNNPEGNVMTKIKDDCRGEAEAIKIKIISKWIRGTGKKPISWETLAGVMESVGLKVLAQDIRQGTQDTEEGKSENVAMQYHSVSRCYYRDSADPRITQYIFKASKLTN